MEGMTVHKRYVLICVQDMASVEKECVNVSILSVGWTVATSSAMKDVTTMAFVKEANVTVQKGGQVILVQ
jgi:hypothetical protein